MKKKTNFRLFSNDPSITMVANYHLYGRCPGTADHYDFYVPDEDMDAYCEMVTACEHYRAFTAILGKLAYAKYTKMEHNLAKHKLAKRIADASTSNTINSTADQRRNECVAA